MRTERAPVAEFYSELPKYLSSQVTWVDSSDQGVAGFESKHSGSDSYVNSAEADAILAIVRAIGERKGTLQKVIDLGGAGAPIGIICMYAAQRDLVRRRLAQSDWAVELRQYVQVGTVDSYQGKENRIVFVSLVRSNATGDCGFLRRPERINVAISRAMDRLVVVGASHMWRERRGSPLHDVLAQVRLMQERGAARLVASTDVLSEQS